MIQVIIKVVNNEGSWLSLTIGLHMYDHSGVDELVNDIEVVRLQGCAAWSSDQPINDLIKLAQKLASSLLKVVALSFLELSNPQRL